MTAPGVLETRVAELIAEGLDEVQELVRLLAFSRAATDNILKLLDAGDVKDPRLVTGWISSLERWGARSESIAVNLRRLRTDARFRKAAHELVALFVEWAIKYVPEHRREAALLDLERGLAMATDTDSR